MLISAEKVQNGTGCLETSTASTTAGKLNNHDNVQYFKIQTNQSFLSHVRVGSQYI